MVGPRSSRPLNTNTGGTELGGTTRGTRCAITVTVTLVVAIVLRRAQRLPFFKPTFDTAIVSQNWRSAASTRGLLKRRGWSRNCTWFVLTDDRLCVGVHFPFNLFMPRFLSGLDVTIPIDAMSRVELCSTFFKGTFVRVTYEATDEARGVVSAEQIDLQPERDSDFFVVLHHKVSRGSPASPSNAT